MSASNVVEIVIYIHGVTQGSQERTHDREYDQLHRGIKKHTGNWPADYCGVEWGDNPVPRNLNPTSHELLATAQRHLGSRVMPAIDDAWDFTLNPARLAVGTIRKLAFYGFSDMFYYVSKDGKDAVRSAVAKQIVDFINAQVQSNGPNVPISISLLGHSAGSVVAFDFLFYLFSNKTSAGGFCPNDPAVSQEMKVLEGRVTAKTLRLRRLITFGSPLTFTIFRSDKILDTLANDGQLDPDDYGLRSKLKGNVAKLSGPRWMNFWDKDDPISFPVEPLMDQPKADAVLDIYSDVSDSITQAHNAYWNNVGFHKEIGARW